MKNIKIKEFRLNKIIILYITFLSTLYCFPIDTKLSKNETGLIGLHYYLPEIFAVSNLAIATYYGSTSRFGKTSFRSITSLLGSILITDVLKKTTGRLRPRESDNPNVWFSDKKGNTSFTSGHVSGVTAIISSYILEYKQDYPSIQWLWLFTAHQMIGRVKAQAHWQTDVIAGALVGFFSAYIERKQKTPLILYLFKNNTFLGLKYRF